MVAAYAQHLGILLLEPAIVLTERGSLIGSARGKVKYMKGENHVLLALVLTQGNISFTDRWEGKIRSWIANLCGHLPPFVDIESGPDVGHLRDYTPG